MKNISELAQELKRRKHASKDFVISSKDLEAMPEDSDIILSGRGAFKAPLTDWAHQQIAEKTGIPLKYYKRMREAGRTRLLADNINAWLGAQERRLVRILDGKVRAVLSDRYRPMDNYDLLFCALEEFERHKVDIHRCDLTDRFLFVKVIAPHDTQEIQKNDLVAPGLILSNSEVGAGSFKVEPFALRLVCKNGLIGEQVIRKIHLGERREVGELWSDQTLRKQDEVLWSEVKDVISATFNPTVFQKWFSQFRNAAGEEISSPVTAVESVAARYEISEKKKNRLLDYFMKQGQPTQWTLGNAISRLAQDEKPEEQIELERIGNQISVMPRADFRELISSSDSSVRQLFL